MKKLSVLIVCICLALLAGLFFTPIRSKILAIEHWTADWRTALLSDRITGDHDRITVIVVTNKTLAKYPYQSPTPRDLIADLIRNADAAGARTIGVDFYFARPTEPNRDDALVAAVNNATANVILGAIEKRHKQFSKQEFEFQDTFLGRMNVEKGFIDLQHEGDDVVRYTSLSADPKYNDAFAWLIAKTAKGEPLPGRSRVAWLVGEPRDRDPFLTISADDVLQAQTNAEISSQLSQNLNGKIILISGEYPYLDRHRTPLSIWNGSKQSGVKIHAHIVAQHLDGRRFYELSRVHGDQLIAGVAFTGFALGWIFWRRKMDFLGLTAATIVLIAIDALIYAQMRLILPFTLSLWAWVLGVTVGHHVHTIFARKA